jgi:hypothetical protein
MDLLRAYRKIYLHHFSADEVEEDLPILGLAQIIPGHKVMDSAKV